MARRKERTPIGNYPVYNDMYDSLSVRSQILNGHKVPGLGTILWDRENTINELARIKGDADGIYVVRGEQYPSVYGSIKVEQSEIEKEIKRYKTNRASMGYDDSDTPAELIERQEQAFAKEDVCLTEIAELERRLSTFTEADKKTENDSVLQYGLRCQTTLHGTRSANWRLIGTLKTIDGQNCEVHEGLLIIKDDRSPYSGMSVIDYRRLAEEWRSLLDSKNFVKLRDIQNAAKAQNLPIPQSLPATSIKRVSKSSLPEWPDWATNHLKLEDNAKRRKS